VFCSVVRYFSSGRPLSPRKVLVKVVLRADDISVLSRLIEVSRDTEARYAVEARDLRREIGDCQQTQRISTSTVMAADVSALYDRIADPSAMDYRDYYITVRQMATLMCVCA